MSCPVKECGDSLTLKLSEIEKVEKEDWSDSHRWGIFGISLVADSEINVGRPRPGQPRRSGPRRHR